MDNQNRGNSKLGQRKRKKKDRQEEEVRPNYWQRLSGWRFVIVIIGIALLLRLYHVTYPLLDVHAFRQTQTASVVRNYYNSGIDPLTPKVDVFGVGKEENLILEFPFYQTIVALLYRVFSPSEIWGRMVSIFFGFLGAFYLFKLVNFLVDKNTALWAGFFFLFAPLNIYYQRVFMMESAVVCFGIMMLYYYTHWIKTDDTSSYLKGIAAASLGFVMKSPYTGVLLLPIAYFQIKHHGFRGLLKVKFLVSVLIPVILMVVWQRYAEGVNVQSGHEFFTLSNAGYQHWCFGKLEYRFSLDYWEKVFNIFSQQVLGRGLIIFFLLGLFLKTKAESGAFFHFWLLTEFIYVLIMFRMVATHHYYNMPLIPITSVYCGYTFNYIFEGEKFSNYLSSFRKKAIIGTLVCSVILLNFFYVKPWYRIDWGTFYSGQVIDRNTKKDVPMIYSPFSGYDWDPRYLYYANRRGINLGHTDLKPKKIAKLQKQGYGYLVIRNLKGGVQLPYQLMGKDDKNAFYLYDLNKPVQ